METEKEKILQKLRESVKDYDSEAVKEATIEALEAGIDAFEAINEGLARGIIELGELFEKEIFVSELMLAGDAFNEGFNILKPHLLKEKAEEKKGIVVLGVVEGDIHDLGKEFVKIMLIAHGFEVIDLGYDVKLEQFIDAVIKNKADILALSALMTSTMVNMKEIIEEIHKKKLDVKIMVGGGPITPEVAEKYGADGWARIAPEGAKKALELIK